MSLSRLLGLTGLVVFASSSIAAAEDAAPHPSNGTWKIATPPDQLRSSLDKAVDDVAQEFNFVIREIARYKLQGATKVCKSYFIEVKGEAVSFACDSDKPQLVPASGGPLHTKNDDGEPITGTAKITDSGVVVAWKGEAGTRVNTFTTTGSGLRLSVQVTSDQMPKPLTWNVDYKK